jgi:GH15 family glucan-1,4-alpha-glucosidase
LSYKYLEGDLLAKESIKLILKNQSPSGSYVASPNFEQYNYGWLRDGSFCALAMYRSGQLGSASRFNSWVFRTVAQHSSIFKETIARLKAGLPVSPDKAPPTRFHLDGSVEHDHHEVWPNYQLDGYGTWLAILEQTQDSFSGKELESVRLVAEFLALAWRGPCYDCWEEGGGQVHGSTLLAISGGLRSAGSILGDERFNEVHEEISRYIETNFVLNGSLIKLKGKSLVDASLMWAALPHGALDLDSHILQETIRRITAELRGEKGGIYRYLGDTYYGGGHWVLLEGFLGWNAAALGNRQLWEDSKAWIVSSIEQPANSLQ